MLITPITVLGQDFSERQLKKAAKKEAKARTKEGWKVVQGALPLKMQYFKLYKMRDTKNDDGTEKYIVGTGEVTAETFTAAYDNALFVAKTTIASYIETRLVGMVKQYGGNAEHADNEAESLQKFISARSEVIANRFGRIVPIVEATQQLKNGNHRVHINVVYDVNTGLQEAKQAIREELEKESRELLKPFDEAMKQIGK